MTRTSGTRAAAVRRAQQAKQRRDAQRIARERQIEATLADFFEQTQRAEDLIANAQARAERIVAEAQKAAEEPSARAAKAIGQLAELVETRSAVCELTGLNAGEVRDLITQANIGGEGAQS